MRIGIMGGTLDPVHNGHIQLAQTALEMQNLDGVMLLPAGDPPHKSRPTLKTDRLEMARLATEGLKGIFPCSIEVFRKGTTYTVDTLHELHMKNPSTEWFYIIGADTLDVLDTWRNFGEVAQLCTFIVFGRADAGASQKRMHELEGEYGAKFIMLPVNGPDISSTELRNRVAQGKSIQDLVPVPVGEYIRDRGLYLSAVQKDRIKEMLQADMKPARYQHTLGVAETAVRLAERYGIDVHRAELAALLHDCAKYMPLDEMRSIVREAVSDADADEMAATSVLHAPAGAVLAARKYGVQDPAIFSAIRKHTIGDAQMKPLDALIYTADFIEPKREEFPGLQDARELAESDLYAAMCKCAQLTNRHLKHQGRQPHPRSLAMLKNYNQTNKEEKI